MSKNYLLLLSFILLFGFANIKSQNQQKDTSIIDSRPNYLPLNGERDERVREYLKPIKIIWMTDSSKTSNIKNAEYLVTNNEDQVTLENSKGSCFMINNGDTPGILLDFGKEIHGGISLMIGKMKNKTPAKFRIRFGESVSEAMSDIGDEQNATNDHAVRDQIISAPWLGSIEIGNTGFRFVRIDLVDTNRSIPIVGVRATFIYRDIEYRGSFISSDTLLNNIWKTGAYTVHLCMQDYVWDGIKRDRLIWIGDMHPETMTILSVFGDQDVVKKSLDLAKSKTPLPNWMNGISSYSMWWLIIHREWYFYTGDKKYLEANKKYIVNLLNQLMTFIGDNNEEILNANRFLDWPSKANPKAVHAGLHALLIKTLMAGMELTEILNVPITNEECSKAIEKLNSYRPDPNNSKQAAALLAIVNPESAKKINEEILAVDGAKRLSTFYGYYVLEARQLAGDTQGSLDAIREYWGGMLKMGATTFWEDFNLDWMENASRIDELVKLGEKDIHGDYGGYCYIGFRHSLCHGWASGPTAWLSEHVLGIKPAEPGFKTVKIEPHLGDLKWVEGTFPTPYGNIWVRHEKLEDGKIKTDYKLPDDVRLYSKSNN